MEQILKILDISTVTHDVKCFRLEKPAGFTFQPGQATDLSINKPGFERELRPFTFTSLTDAPYLEFTIKRYADHQGVTEKLHTLMPGDELIIRDAWGAIEYRGPGYFIAGGAGITPFISILRQLKTSGDLAGNTLFFANKTAEDVIYREELVEMLGNRAVFLFSRETGPGQESRRIDESYLRQHVTDYSGHFYVCGPDAMVADVNGLLEKAGASTESMVFEK